jgi:FMN-dependent NADH-azoreductase
MKQALVIDASHNHQSNGSRFVAQSVVAKFLAAHPGARVIHRDLAALPAPHFVPDAPDALRRSDELIDELLASDLLVIATPVWNFGPPSTVKAWVDHIVCAGRTFNYAAHGVEGHVKNTRAVIVAASGAIFSTGPWTHADHTVPYLRHILSFIGITQIDVVRVEGTIQAPDAAIPNAQNAVATLQL